MAYKIWWANGTNWKMCYVKINILYNWWFSLVLFSLFFCCNISTIFLNCENIRNIYMDVMSSNFEFNISCNNDILQSLLVRIITHDKFNPLYSILYSNMVYCGAYILASFCWKHKKNVCFFHHNNCWHLLKIYVLCMNLCVELW